MSDTPRLVTGVFRAPSGQVYPNKTIVIYRRNRKVVAQGASVVVDEIERTTLNTRGEIEVSLLPGAYLGRIALEDADRYFEFGVLEGSGEYSIEDAIENASPFLQPASVAEAQEARDQARAWAESATAPGEAGTKSSKTWATESAVSAAAALTQADRANTEADRAEVARDDASAVAGIREFRDVTTLIANTTLTYTAGQTGTVTAGDIVRPRSEGFAYEVVAADATDQNITTAGGVKLRRLPGALQRLENGFAQHARNTLNTLSMWSDDYIGTNGAGGVDWFPRPITASQTGTTVTASTAVFLKLYVGARIIWVTGEEAIITAVDNAGAGWAAITNCTVDRSQTVASGAATIRTKHMIGISYGDSVGNRIAGVLEKLLWRTLGFGGYVFTANNWEGNFGGQVAAVNLSGGAAEVSGSPHYAEFPWGQHWSIPASGSVTISLINNYANGNFRKLRQGFEHEEKKTNTFTVVWRREAGAFTVERKRFYDTSWELVDTIVDASTGARAFNFKTYSHDLRSDWQYRCTTTSGAVRVALFILKNDSVSGYVHWPMSRGGDLIENFDALESVDLAELCQIVGQPDFRTIFAYDAGATSGNLPADYTPEMAADRALWQAAAPCCDHVWFTGWEANTNEPQQRAWNQEILITALGNDDSMVTLEDLFADYATSGSLRGWVEDGVHPSIKAETIIAHRFFRAVGLADFPTVNEGRDVFAKRGEFSELKILGRDVGKRIGNLERSVALSASRGLRWNFADQGTLRGQLSGAIGTGDFTMLWQYVARADLNQRYLALVNTDGLNLIANNQFAIIENGSTLLLYLRDGFGNSIEYRFRFAHLPIVGQRGILVLKGDASQGQFDLYWNGEPMVWVATEINGVTTTPFGTWEGIGDRFSIPQGTVAGREDFLENCMVWRTALSEAEIKEVSETGRPGTRLPDFWWDFSEGIGRAVEDKTGNGRHGHFYKSNPQGYNVAQKPVWRFPKHGKFGLPWVADQSQITVLTPGDDVIAAYTANRDMLLPVAASLGDMIRVTINSSSLIRITQNAGQQIKSGGSATTVGTGGRLTIPNATSVTLRCVVGGASTIWVVESHTGAALTWT